MNIISVRETFDIKMMSLEDTFFDKPEKEFLNLVNTFSLQVNTLQIMLKIIFKQVSLHFVI